jgi:hypothetical protein
MRSSLSLSLLFGHLKRAAVTAKVMAMVRAALALAPVQGQVLPAAAKVVPGHPPKAEALEEPLRISMLLAAAAHKQQPPTSSAGNFSPLASW